MNERQPWYAPLRRSLINMPDIVLLSTALLAIGIIVYDSINNLRVTNQREWVLLAVTDLVLLGYFVVILADSHSKSEDRVQWWRWNALSIIALFPLFATTIPGFGWAGVLRFFLLIPAIQAIFRMLNLADDGEVSIQQRITHLFIIVTLLILAGGVLTLMFELKFEEVCKADVTCDESELVLNLEDAIWWAVETTTTVGYGEYAPKSLGARVVATMLLFVGIGVVGTLAATLSQLFFSNQMWRNTQREDFLTRLHLLTDLHDRGDLSDTQFERAKRRLVETTQEDERILSTLSSPQVAISEEKSLEISDRRQRLEEARQFFSEVAENGERDE